MAIKVTHSDIQSEMKPFYIQYLRIAFVIGHIICMFLFPALNVAKIEIV